MRWGARDLHVAYGATLALRGVTIEAVPGEIAAVVGGDGAGKTTLLRALAGAVRPASGTVNSPPLTQLGFMLLPQGIGILSPTSPVIAMALTASC